MRLASDWGSKSFTLFEALPSSSGAGLHEEEIDVHVFSRSLRQSIEEFLADPSGPPLVPNWLRVWAGGRDAGPMLLAAVEEETV
jgi:hypothetical protein